MTAPSANGARGEVLVRLGVQPRRLCLTLGALAEIETALGLAGWNELAERLRRLSAADLTVVLAALLRGGGETAEDAEEIAFAEAAEAVAAAFSAAGG